MTLTVLLPRQVWGQSGSFQARVGRWGLSLAASHQSVNDEIASPLRKAGVGPAVGLLYRSRGRQSDWGIGISYGSPSLESVSSGDASGSEDVHDFTLQFAHLRRILGADGARFAIYAGAGTNVRLVVRIHHYRTMGSETYADGLAPLETQAMWTYATGAKKVLSGRLAVAAFSMVARDPYTGAKYRPAKVEVMDPVRTRMLRHILSYRFGMGPSFDGVPAHELTYFRYPEPRHIVMATRDLRFTLEWKR